MNDIFSNPVLAKALPEAIIETLQMVGISSFFTVLIGLPLGVFLHVSAPGGLRPMPVTNRILSDVIVNITRSIPFAILMVALIPLARALTGTSLGPVAASVSLSIGTIPFFARLVENCLRDVHHGKIDAAQVMGSTKMQVINKVMLRESLPALVAAATTTVVTLVGFSAMAGLVGGYPLQEWWCKERQAGRGWAGLPVSVAAGTRRRQRWSRPREMRSPTSWMTWTRTMISTMVTSMTVTSKRWKP